MSDFVGLHVHSQNSFLDGYSSIESIVSRAKKLNQKAVALTDHQEVGGHFRLQKECRKNDIKPIFGCEGYLVDSVSRVREEKDRNNSHITLLAKNKKGLNNLWAWTTEAYNDNFYYRALQDWDGARKYADGLFASDGCLLSYMADSIIKDDEGRQHELMAQYLDVFGENFYMELHTFQFIEPQTARDVELNQQMTKVNQAKVELAKQYGVPLVVVNDSHYTQREDWVEHALLWKFNTKNNQDALEGSQTATWMMDDSDIIYFMSKHGISEDITREAIKNTSWIAEQCNVEIESGLHMPSLSDSERDEMKTFLDTVSEGFERKIVQRGLDAELYFERLESEIKTITDKKFHSYFNVVADYSRWCKHDSDILMGPSRGSAGGSLVAYVMDITEVDPIKYDLIFSRFISEDRQGFPDIDLDFPKSRRGEVVEYLGNKYGHDHICGIGSLGTGKPKGLLKDLSRAYGIPLEEANQMSKILGKVKDIDTARVDVSWEEVLDQAGDDLKPFIRRYPELFEKMNKMAGVIRQPGTHAAGVVVSNKPLLGILPTRKGNSGISSAFTKDEVEELGFVKLDVLGLRHLDTLQVAHDLILERHGVDLDYLSFDDKYFDDPDIWKCFETGDVNGIFQAETTSMTKVGRRIKPKNVEELAILFSVNRPGVVRAGLLDVFLDRWEGIEPVHSDHPMMDEVVGDTMGIVVYQEQVMKAVQVISGFSPTEADKVRKIISKQKMEEMKKLKIEFIERACSNTTFVELSETGNPQLDAENIWRGIETTAIYAFNKSHAVGYAILAAWELWVKKYYLIEFLTALATTDKDKYNNYVSEARRKGIKIAPPDVNASQAGFSIDGNTIHYGLLSLKGVGGKATDAIVKNQTYVSLDDFLDKTKKQGVNKTVVTTLIRVGAFDSLHPDRSSLLRTYYDMKKVKDADVPDFTDEEVVYQTELELTGNFITRDPLAKFEPMIRESCITTMDEFEEVEPGNNVIIGGKTSLVKKHIDSNGNEMAFIDITFDDEAFSMLCFAKDWARISALVEESKPMIVLATKLDGGSACIKRVERLDYKNEQF